MDQSNRLRRGLIKGKLMPFYRVAKPSSIVQYSTKVKPSQSSPPATSVGFMVHHQDYVVAQPKQKISFVVPAAHDNSINSSNREREKLSRLEKLLGVVGGDESVDIKAASYISSVQERFKLERVNSERMKQEGMHN